MSCRIRPKTSALVLPSAIPEPSGVLQRKCACGGSSALDGECIECQGKRLTLQRYSSDRAPDGLMSSHAQLLQRWSPADAGAFTSARLGHNFGLVQTRVPLGLQTKLAVSQATDQHEQEADRLAERVIGPATSDREGRPIGLSPTEPVIQRAAANFTTSNETTGSSASAATAAPTIALDGSAAPLIVEDNALEVGPGQMRKSEFMGLLQAEVYAIADEILPTVGRSADNCPYITNWIAYGYIRGASYVESFIRRFGAGLERVAAASDYIPLVGERIRRAMLVWAVTGEITGVPEYLAEQLPATNERSAVRTVGAQVADERADTSSETVRSTPRLKAREGSPSGDVAPRDVQRRLGRGESLDGNIRARMEAALGYDFSRVRIHHDANAAHLSSTLNARAFTVGDHVAFGMGEYEPGSLVGDALLAHELAHVVQQGGAQPAAQTSPANSDPGSLEEDADRSAIGAVFALWGRARAGLANISENALPRLRSGLRLSRCSSCRTENDVLEDAGKQREAGAPDAGTPDAAQARQQPAPPPGTSACSKSLAPDQVIVDHRVDPTPAVIEKPGDKVKFTATFACTVIDDAFSKIAAGTDEFGRKKVAAKGLGQITRDWDGTKLFTKIGTYLVDDGVNYIHRLEPIKYAFKYDAKTKKTEDLKTSGPKHDSPPVRVAARAFRGAGPNHVHYTAANADALAEIIESEVGVGNDSEKKAVAWCVRNQMIRHGTGVVTVARDHFGDAHDQAAKPATKTLAEEILKKPMSDDITNGAIKWYSPKGMLEMEKAGKNVNCRGGRTKETDDSGTAHNVCAPDWSTKMDKVTVTGVRDWFLKVYKLRG